MKTIITICFLLFGVMAVHAQTLIPFKDGNGKYGYKDLSGNVAIQPKYDNADYFNEKIAARVNIGYSFGGSNGKWGFIDKTGKEITPIKYDDAKSFSQGLAAVSLNKKYGYIDRTGKVTIPFKYDNAGDFYEGFAYVKLNGKFGFIDNTGKEIIPFLYQSVNNFYGGKAKVRFNGKEFFIDKTGKEITDNKQQDNNSAALPQQFYNQFKTMLAANWTELKGDFKEKKTDEVGDMYYYLCKKTIDGFQTEYFEADEGELLLGANAWKTNANAQIFQQIKTELEKVKADGYSVDGTLSNLWRIKKDGYQKANVQFDGKNSIRLTFFKGKRKNDNKNIDNIKTPDNKTSGNYNQLIGVWNVNATDQKFGMSDDFKIEIKKITNNKAEVWMLDNGKPYKQYKDFEIAKQDNGSLGFAFQFSHDEKKILKGTGTISSNFSQMKGTQLTPLTNTSMQTEDWTATKENSSNNDTKPINNKKTPDNKTIDNKKKYATVTSPQPAENNFLTEIATAATSETRGAALNKYINAVMASNYSDDEKGALIADKYASVMPVDFHAVHWSMMKTDTKAVGIIVAKVYKILPADQVKALKDMSQYRIAEYQAKYNNAPKPLWPANVPQRGQGWK